MTGNPAHESNDIGDPGKGSYQAPGKTRQRRKERSDGSATLVVLIPRDIAVARGKECECSPKLGWAKATVECKTRFVLTAAGQSSGTS